MKSWKRSRTLWFNATVASLITFEASLHLLQPFVSADVYGLFALLLAVGNTFLRVITSEGISK